MITSSHLQPPPPPCPTPDTRHPVPFAILVFLSSLASCETVLHPAFPNRSGRRVDADTKISSFCHHSCDDQFSKRCHRLRVTQSSRPHDCWSVRSLFLNQLRGQVQDSTLLRGIGRAPLEWLRSHLVKAPSQRSP